MSKSKSLSQKSRSQCHVVSDIDRSNSLNTYFSSIGTVDYGRLSVMATNKRTCIQARTFTRPTDIVTAAIRKLKSNLSSGSDGLPFLLFKCCCGSLSQPLAIMLTQIFVLCLITDDW